MSITIDQKTFDIFFQSESDLDKIFVELNKALPEKMRKQFYYKKVSESRVSEYVLRAADKVLKTCREKLKLPGLKIQWLEKTRFSSAAYKSGLPMFGMISGADLLLIRHDIPLREVLHTIAHEAHHVWFRLEYGKKYPLGPENAEMWESSADTFAWKILIDLQEREENLEKYARLRGSYVSR